MKKKIYCRPESLLVRIQGEGLMAGSTLEKTTSDTTDSSWSNRNGGWSSDNWSDSGTEE